MAISQRPSTHVPAQYYGYSLQCTHLVFLLLDAVPGTKISLEVLEDVASEDPSGEIQAVQLKSAHKTNPITNRAIDLWKTFRNWINAIQKQELELGKTLFRLHLGRKRAGGICQSFAAATNVSQAQAAITRAKTEFFTKSGKLRVGINTELAEIISCVFSAANADLLKRVVARFELSFGMGHAYAELLDRIKTKLIDEDLAEDVLLHGLGWVKKQIDNAIESDRQPLVAVDDFRTELMAFRDRLRARAYLPSFAGPPSLADIELNRLRTFVKQLNLIEFSEDHVLQAIADFLSTRANRVRYASKGAIHSDSFTEFENALYALWMNHRDELELDKNDEEINRGRRLALRCLRETLRLQGIDVPADFVRGSFHVLADIPTIGWHPRYVELLKEIQNK